MAEVVFDALVIGAGIHGLCAAWQLRRRGLTRVAVLDRFPAGHARGSSHGESRITRSSYHHPLYIRLAQTAHAEDWPCLAADIGVVPIVSTPGVFFGPDVPRFRAFVATTLAAGANVEAIEAREAARRFPLLRLHDAASVLLDHTAGVVRADVVLRGLRAWLAGHGVEVADSTRVLALRSQPDYVAVDTERGERRAAHVVVACGAGVSALLPSLRARFEVRRQSVGYFELHAAPARTQAPEFPVWARIGDEVNDFVYGTPAVGAGGVKLARHVTLGRVDGAGPNDAEQDVPIPSPAALEDLDACARLLFGDAVRGRLRSETCLYTMTPDEHFVVDALCHDPRIVVCAACSGHAFKFGPTLGRLAVDVLLHGARPPVEFALAR